MSLRFPWRRHAARALALLIILALYGFARIPDISLQDRKELAGRFHFTQIPLPEPKDYPYRYVRSVNPSLNGISAWISSVGAAVALNDLDGDGLSNDFCQVDPRTEQAMIAPVPGTGHRYDPLFLSPKPLPYDEDTMAPMGCLPGDFNEDGRMDLVVYYWGRTPIAFLKTDDNYYPIEVASQIERWFTNAATIADWDGDGHVDLVVANYFQDGDHILDAKASTSDCMGDSMSRAYNGGGTHFFLWAGAKRGQTPSVSFSHIADVLKPFDTGWTLAAGAADLDGDLLPELYLANDFGPDRLLHNRSSPGHLSFAILKGERSIFTPSSKVLGNDSFKGMGIDFADVNGDGLLDMFVSNIAAEYALEESHFAFVSTGRIEQMKMGIAPYIDRSESLGLARSDWSWEFRLADFDNDSVYEAMQATGFVKGKINRWPELHELAMGNDQLLRNPWFWPRFQPGDDLSGQTHNPFYVKAKNGRYYDVAPDLGLAQPHISRGIATADVDGDGDVDFVVGNQWEPSYFYRNDCPRCGSFLGLHLRLPIESTDLAKVFTFVGHPAGSFSRPAIGASARVRLPDGRILVGQVEGGNGHSGKRSPDLHFGLSEDARDQPLEVELHWRDSSGAAHQQDLRLMPGWHTIMLGELARS